MVESFLLPLTEVILKLLISDFCQNKTVCTDGVTLPDEHSIFGLNVDLTKAYHGISAYSLWDQLGEQNFLDYHYFSRIRVQKYIGFAYMKEF